MISRSDVEQLLLLGNESASFEVKGPGSPRDKAFAAKVARAVMAMGNRRDGGVVCVGVDQAVMASMGPGLTPEQVTQWGDLDLVAAKLALYSDPPPSFELRCYELSMGTTVAVLDVDEFDVVPHVCQRNHEGELREGMVYVRPRGMPKSVPVPTSVDMRDLLDLAIAKGVREWVRVSAMAGVPVAEPKSSAQRDAEAYAQERSVAWSRPSECLADIDNHARFDVAVYPTQYQQVRLLSVDLESFVVSNAVRLRGWPVPFVAADAAGLVRREGSIGQDLEASFVPHLEAWRMVVSGQFLHRRVVATDLRDAPDLRAADPEIKTIAVWDVLLYLVELAELAARMSTALEVDEVSITVSLRGAEDRELISGDWARDLHGRYVIPSESVDATGSFSAARLLAEPRAVGVELAQEMLASMGLRVQEQVLLDWQAQVFGGGSAQTPQ